MKRLILEPNGWQCTLEECPAGLFVYNDSIGFKSEYYSEKGNMEIFCESGEAFWGGMSTDYDRRKLIVQPVIAEWEDVDG